MMEVVEVELGHDWFYCLLNLRNSRSRTPQILIIPQNKIISVGKVSNFSCPTSTSPSVLQLYSGKLYAPLNFLGTYYRIIQNAFTDTENLLELLGEKPEPLEPENPVSVSSAAVSLGLDKVSFKYQSDQERQILADVDFYIPSGQTWALVGESGSGKSTISRFAYFARDLFHI